LGGILVCASGVEQRGKEIIMRREEYVSFFLPPRPGRWTIKVGDGLDPFLFFFSSVPAAIGLPPEQGREST